MKKRLLIFHPTIGPYRIDFFNDLSRAFDTRVCLMYYNLASQKFDYEKITAQFEFQPIYLERKQIGHYYINRGYWKQLDDWRPDVVLVSEFGEEAAIVWAHRTLKRRKYKMVSVCDDCYQMVTQGRDFSRTHTLGRKVFARRMDEILLVEPRTVEWYQQHYRRGFFFPIIRQDERARVAYRQALHRSDEIVKKYHIEGKRLFLFVGRLVALKNVETLIRAFATLDQDENRLAIVGDGPQMDSLIEVAKEVHAKVLFTGRLEGDELNAWYNLAACFILPSHMEAFGAVVNEALLAGCWTLVSTQAGAQCLVEDGVNGQHFDPENTQQLADCLHDAAQRLPRLSLPIDLKSNAMHYNYNDLMARLIERLNEL